MSIMYLMGHGMMGGSQWQSSYCHACRSTQCYHILGAQQNMGQQEYYNQLMRLADAQQQAQGQPIPSIHTKRETGFPPEKPRMYVKDEPVIKPNKKLLLLKR